MGCSKARTSPGNFETEWLESYLHLLRGTWHAAAQWAARKCTWPLSIFEQSLSAGKTIPQQERDTMRTVSRWGVTGEWCVCVGGTGICMKNKFNDGDKVKWYQGTWHGELGRVPVQRNRDWLKRARGRLSPPRTKWKQRAEGRPCAGGKDNVTELSNCVWSVWNNGPESCFPRQLPYQKQDSLSGGNGCHLRAQHRTVHTTLTPHSASSWPARSNQSSWFLTCAQQGLSNLGTCSCYIYVVFGTWCYCL